MRKSQTLLLRLIRYTITILFGMMIVYLAYVMAFTTATVSFNEISYVLTDSFGLNLLVLVIAVLGGCLLFRHSSRLHRFIEKINTDEAFSKKARRVAMAVFGIAAAVLVLVLQKVPVADQKTVCDTALAWTEHDYSSFEPDQYLGKYPQQLGITTFLYLLSLVFGAHNYLAVQLLNVGALLVIYKTFAELSDLSGQSRFTGFCILVAFELFLPATLYVTFVYGTWLGLACSVTATKAILLLHRDGKKRHLAAAVVLSFLAIMLKSNYQIYLIGNLILVVVLLLRSCNLKKAVLLVLLALVLALNGTMLRGIAYALTGQEEGSGMSSWVWVDMGIREGSYRYDGWYDSFIEDTFEENNYDADAQGQEALQEIQNRLRYFKAHPMAALSFFSRKNASQWSEPTFQSLWINERMGSLTGSSPVVSWLFTIEGSGVTAGILNYVCFLIVAGVLPFLFLKKQKSDIFTVFAVIFIGGFLFHTIWEAKGQYTFPYFLMLIPMSVIGYKSLIQRLSHVKLPALRENSRRILSVLKERNVILALSFVLLGCGIRFCALDACHTILKTSQDLNDYQEYAAERVYVQEQVGDYELNGVVTPGWMYWFGSAWYYLREDGTPATGWIQVDDAWYYLQEDGTMATGWINLNNQWYYLHKDGTRTSGAETINGKIYIFNHNGVLVG